MQAKHASGDLSCAKTGQEQKRGNEAGTKRKEGGGRGAALYGSGADIDFRGINFMFVFCWHFSGHFLRGLFCLFYLCDVDFI